MITDCNSFIKNEINSYKDKKIASFSSKLTPTKYEIVGIRIPILRDIAKRFIKRYENDIIDYLKNPLKDNFEEIMLYGMIIGMLKLNNNANGSIIVEYKYLELQIDNFTNYIDNWAICDVFVGGLKNFAKHKDSWNFSLNFLESNDEFKVRFGVVMLLSHFIKEEFIDEILILIPRIKHQGYYAKMALAWLISVCYVKFNQKTENLLKQKILDKFVQNKAISKINDSFRVDESSKLLLKNYRLQ